MEPSSNMSAMSSLESLGSITSNAASNSQIQKSGNMLSQLETMMNAVKKEAASLEKMKVKMKELDELKIKVPELKNKLLAADNEIMDLNRRIIESDTSCNQLRADMQHLNDMYSSERAENIRSQQINNNLQKELNQLRSDNNFLKKENEKIPELKKQNQSLMNQIGQLSSKLEESRLQSQSAVQALEKKLVDNEKNRGEASKHVWNLSEEVKSLKREIELQEEKFQEEEKLRVKKQAKIALLADRFGMSNEDHVRLLEKRHQIIRSLQTEQQNQIRELDALKHALSTKDEQFVALTSKLKSFEEARSVEKSDVKSKIVALNELIATLKAQNHDLDRELSESRHQYALLSGDIPRYTSEIDSLKLDIQRLEGLRTQRENEILRDVKSFASQKEEYLRQIESLHQQVESVQLNTRNIQQRHWEELQRLQQESSQKQSEVDQIQQQVRQQILDIHKLEAEKISREEFWQHEISDISSNLSTLREELERRLLELNQVKSERDLAQEELKETKQKIDNLKDSLQKVDVESKKSLQEDRMKSQTEWKQFRNRIQVLEHEKEEFLQETHSLMQQVTDSQRDVQRMRKEVEQHLDTNQKHQDKQQELTRTIQSLEGELLQSRERETVAKETIQRLESQAKEDIQRLESVVKEAKKVAVKQVTEWSSRVQALSEEIEGLKTHIQDLTWREEKARTDLEKWKNESQEDAKRYETKVQQREEELFHWRREGQELRAQLHRLMESHTQLEGKVLQSQRELLQQEKEIHRLQSTCRDSETKEKSFDTREQQWKQEKEDLQERLKKLQQQLVQSEESSQQYQKQGQHWQQEKAHQEQEFQAEIRRLRLQVLQKDQELQEVRPLLPMLQKELQESQSQYGKLQQSSHASVSSLLEELKATEDGFSQARKQWEKEIESWRMKVGECQHEGERQKEEFEDIKSKWIVEKSDRDRKVVQLEGEVERWKTFSSHKEQRVEELEKQHQNDRMKLQENKERLEIMERQLMECKTNFELELNHRKRLENRLRESGISSNSNNDGFSNAQLNPNNSGNTSTALSAFVHTNGNSSSLNNYFPPTSLNSLGGLNASVSTSMPNSNRQILVSNSSPVLENGNYLSDGGSGDMGSELAANTAVRLTLFPDNGRPISSSLNNNNLTSSNPFAVPVNNGFSNAQAVDRVAMALAARLSSGDGRVAMGSSSSSSQYLAFSNAATSTLSPSPIGFPTGINSTGSGIEDHHMLGNAESASPSGVSESASDVEKMIAKTQKYLHRKMTSQSGGPGVSATVANNNSLPSNGAGLAPPPQTASKPFPPAPFLTPLPVATAASAASSGVMDNNTASFMIPSSNSQANIFSSPGSSYMDSTSSQYQSAADLAMSVSSAAFNRQFQQNPSSGNHQTSPSVSALGTNGGRNSMSFSSFGVNNNGGGISGSGNSMINNNNSALTNNNGALYLYADSNTEDDANFARKAPIPRGLAPPNLVLSSNASSLTAGGASSSRESSASSTPSQSGRRSRSTSAIKDKDRDSVEYSAKEEGLDDEEAQVVDDMDGLLSNGEQEDWSSALSIGGNFSYRISDDSINSSSGNSGNSKKGPKRGSSKREKDKEGTKRQSANSSSSIGSSVESIQLPRINSGGNIYSSPPLNNTTSSNSSSSSQASSISKGKSSKKG